MTITVINQIGSAQLATELEEQPKFTAETLRKIALDMDASDELKGWADDVAAHCDQNARAAIRALAASVGEAS